MAKKFQISNNIRKLRFFANEMTQQELAEKAGISRQTVISIEAGKYSPSLELAFRIAEAFGVQIGEVFSYTVE
jgi:putative transcriptional regulator